MAKYRLQALYQRLGLVGDPGAVRAGALPSPLMVLLRFIGSRLSLTGSRQGRRSAVSDQDFVSRTARLAGALGLEAGKPVRLVGGRHQWQSSGQQFRRGERLLLLAAGRLYLSRAMDVSLSAGSTLWYRFGDGPVHKALGGATLISADRDGELQLIAAAPGDFTTAAGEIDTAAQLPLPLSGELQVVVMPALTEPERLAQARALEPTLFADMAEAAPLPHGWQHLWRMGQGRIFSMHDNGEIDCCTCGDVGIVQYPISLPLEASLRLSWAWLVESLPSRLPESIQATHDYLSIAVEFDNGRDLTYMWSAELPEGAIFQCPLPWWDQRETHWVLRNDPRKLGQWLTESRPLLDDYRRAIGGELPGNVVAVWLIANSVFQRGEGRCRYRDIALENHRGRYPVPTVSKSGR